MSGGVDSSVAAALLQSAGYEVIGLFMRHGTQLEEACQVTPSGKQTCCSATDAADARRVADRLDIPFYVLDFQEPFTRIIDYFVDEYIHARTPNPCIVCNTWLKFGKLFEYADDIGAEYVATGHYAQLVDTDEGGRALLRGIDDTKDQTYALFGIDRDKLDRILLPIGEHRKNQIRRQAEALELSVADKPDSQEICFIPDQDHARFIRDYYQAKDAPQPETSGPIVTVDGTVVGEHNGFERFTIGQRKGLRVAMGDPYFVVRIEPETCSVVIGPHESLAREELFASETNWLIDPPEQPIEAEVKIRYRSRPAKATVVPLAARRTHVQFAEPCYGIAPGQAAVFYEGNRLLGGGWIE
jgi:tRNA-specific 2-thiouridylase